MANVIFTKTALGKIHENNLSQKIIYEVIQNADRSFAARQPGTTQFQRQWDYGTVTVIAKRSERGEWIVLSCWLKQSNSFRQRPADKQPQNASFLEKLLLTFKKMLRL